MSGMKQKALFWPKEIIWVGPTKERNLMFLSCEVPAAKGTAL